MTVRICYFLSWNRTTSEKDTYHLSSLHFDDGRWASNLSSKLCFCTTNAGSRRLGNKFKGTIFVNSLDGYIQCTHLGSVDTLFPFFPLNFYSQISTLTVVDKGKRREIKCFCWKIGVKSSEPLELVTCIFRTSKKGLGENDWCLLRDNIFCEVFIKITIDMN